MVAKISSGSSIFGALAYNQIKVDEHQGKVILTNRMIEPRDGNYKVGICMRSFEQQMVQSGEIIKEKQLKGRTKAIVTKAMQLPLSRADFEKCLAANGMNVVFRLNDAGRIYGVTFIDQQNKCALNGSRLGKDFSANVFNELFPFSKEDNDMRLQQQPGNNIGYADEPDSSSQRDVDNSDAALNIFSMETNNGTDSEEEAFIRRMSKKKRRKM